MIACLSAHLKWPCNFWQNADVLLGSISVRVDGFGIDQSLPAARFCISIVEVGCPLATLGAC